MEINRGRGKLYNEGNQQFIDTIDYKLNEEVAAEPTRWWGELTFNDSVNARDNDRFIIELEDGRTGRCYLKKLVNRVARGVPPRYVYHFTGASALEHWKKRR
ncbi:hypothetical protein ACFLYF_04535 [Chloroflexota bacterium]